MEPDQYLHPDDAARLSMEDINAVKIGDTTKVVLVSQDADGKLRVTIANVRKADVADLREHIDRITVL